MSLVLNVENTKNVFAIPFSGQPGSRVRIGPQTHLRGLKEKQANDGKQKIYRKM